MKKIILFAILIFSINIWSQTEKKSKVPEWKGNIEKQFSEVYSKSGKYQDYKVIKAYWFVKLKKNTLDSLRVLDEKISKLKAKITNNNTNISKLQIEIKNKNNKIKTLQGQKDNISLLGAQLSKKTYNVLLWSIISLLVILLALFVYKYSNSNQITKETLANYKDLSNEYQAFKTRSLEREQGLQRKLLDEINKHN